MGSFRVRPLLSIFVAALLACSPLQSTLAGNTAIGKVVPRGPAELNGSRLALETTAYAGDTVKTSSDGRAVVLLPNDAQVHVGPASRVQLLATEEAVMANLSEGALLARSGKEQAVAVQALGLRISPQGEARYVVALAENAVLVSSGEGTVSVEAVGSSHSVPAGRTMRFELAPASQGPGTGGGVAWGVVLGVSIAAGAAGVLIGWLIATNRAEDRCKQRVRALSPAAPESVCEF